MDLARYVWDPVRFTRAVFVGYAKNLDNYVDAFVNVNDLNNDHLNTKLLKSIAHGLAGTLTFLRFTMKYDNPE